MEKLFNWISVVFGLLGGFLVSCLGGWDKWLYALIFMVGIDYITGLAKAWSLKQLSSVIGFIGIIKKVMIFLVVGVGVVLQGLVENAIPLREVVICFYIANEGISLLENIAVFTPIPDKLKDVLLQIRDKGDAKNE